MTGWLVLNRSTARGRVVHVSAAAFIWLMIACGCGGSEPPNDTDSIPETPSSESRIADRSIPDPAVSSILERSSAAISSSLSPADVRTIHTVADVQGPDYSFVTDVVSSVDGRTRLEQRTPPGTYILGIDRRGVWSLDPESDSLQPADLPTKMFVRGHELHMTALHPGSRFSEPELADPLEQVPGPALADSAVRTVVFRDELGADVLISYSDATGLPVGMKFRNHTGSGETDIFVELSDWQQVEGINLFMRADFHQGADRYEYRYRVVDVNPERDGLFALQ